MAEVALVTVAVPAVVRNFELAVPLQLVTGDASARIADADRFVDGFTIQVGGLRARARLQMVRHARRRDERTPAERALDGGPAMNARVSVLQACEDFHANHAGETYMLELVCVSEFALAILAVELPMSKGIHVLVGGALRRERAVARFAFVGVVDLTLGAGIAVRSMGAAVVRVLLESMLAIEVSVTGLAPRHGGGRRIGLGIAG